MKKLPWVILLLSSTVTFAAPAKKVFPVLDREPYVDQAVENSPLTPGVCETSIQAPVGYVIESVSFRAATLPSSLSPELGNYSGLEQEVFVQVTTGGVAGNFFSRPRTNPMYGDPRRTFPRRRARQLSATPCRPGFTRMRVLTLPCR